MTDRKALLRGRADEHPLDPIDLLVDLSAAPASVDHRPEDGYQGLRTKMAGTYVAVELPYGAEVWRIVSGSEVGFPSLN